ncbi:MAG: GNAT family N-acetyltransferase [Acidimicrobiia bacterium]|nr:GNAT family N-acetyltransferase [Acidimicrobiia bacterium]
MPVQESIHVAAVTGDEQIVATCEVMRQLRPAVKPEDYLPTVRRMMETDGYRLAAAFEGNEVRAVAGYRYMEMLYYGKILYVDDLSTDEAHRSKGYGKMLLEWLKAEAHSRGCSQLQLDSGVQRDHAHRFYFREGFAIKSYHFRIEL